MASLVVSNPRPLRARAPSRPLRISSRVTAINVRLSALAAEASAAKNGLRLLARACSPLLERCRSLAAQKRLLTRWYGSLAAGEAVVRERELHRGWRDMAGAPPDTTLLVDGLRALVAALGSREAGGQDGNSVVGGEDGMGRGFSLGSMPSPPLPRVAGEPRGVRSGVRCQDQEGRRDGLGCEGHGRTVSGSAGFRCHPVVSLRAVGIASVAVQRLRRLAACRARHREAARRAGDVGGAGDDDNTKPRGDRPGSGNSTGKRGGGGGVCGEEREDASTGGLHSPVERSSPGRTVKPGRSPVASRANVGDFSNDDDVIPLGPWGFGGVALLSEADVPPLPPTALANEGHPEAFLLSSAANSRRGSARCLALLSALVVPEGGSPGGEGGRVGRDGMAEAPTLLQVLAAGQPGHWRRLEERGLVPTRFGDCGDGGGGGYGDAGSSRVFSGRCAR